MTRPALRQHTARRAGWVALATVATVCLGVFSVSHARIGVAIAGALFVIGMTAISPVALPVLAFPTIIVVERVDVGGVDLSASDFMLFAALWPALFFCPRPFSRPIRTILWLSALYQVLTLFAVILNPYRANVVEWFHAWLLISGALIVGWAVGKSGYGRVALTAFLCACAALAGLTLFKFAVQFPQVGLQPVYLNVPFEMHKNFIGCTLSFGAVLAYCRPTWLRWRNDLAGLAFALCSAGVFASQARQALVALSVAILVIALRPDPDRRRSKWVVVLAIPALIFVYSAFQDQLDSDNTFNSTYQRFTWYDRTLDIWQTQPIFGVGLRWWLSGRFPGDSFQPPNAELEVLSSTGVVGLAGFVIMFGGVLCVLWRINPRYGTLAVVMVVTRLVQGQFDLFWIAVHVPIPMLMAGLCLGELARSAERRPDEVTSAKADYRTPPTSTRHHAQSTTTAARARRRLGVSARS